MKMDWSSPNKLIISAGAPWICASSEKICSAFRALVTLKNTETVQTMQLQVRFVLNSAPKSL